jgi:hypothetical protein
MSVLRPTSGRTRMAPDSVNVVLSRDLNSPHSTVTVDLDANALGLNTMSYLSINLCIDMITRAIRSIHSGYIQVLSMQILQLLAIFLSLKDSNYDTYEVRG